MPIFEKNTYFLYLETAGEYAIIVCDFGTPQAVSELE